MNDPILDKENQGLQEPGRGQLWIAAACIALSTIGSVLWLVMLISPHVVR